MGKNQNKQTKVDLIIPKKGLEYSKDLLFEPICDQSGGTLFMHHPGQSLHRENYLEY